MAGKEADHHQEAMEMTTQTDKEMKKTYQDSTTMPFETSLVMTP